MLIRKSFYLLCVLLLGCGLSCKKSESNANFATPGISLADVPEQPPPSSQIQPVSSAKVKVAPPAPIIIDGQFEDWNAVPDFDCKVKEDSHPSHDTQEIKIAHDDQNLYVFFRFKLGIGEKIEKEFAATGRASSGAIGYLKLTSGADQFNLWLPTGFTQKADKTAGTVAKPQGVVSVTVGKFNPSTKQFEKILEKEFPEHPDFIAFEGPMLEFKLPLDVLGLDPKVPMTCEHTEM